jgi:hypothetical protein
MLYGVGGPDGTGELECGTFRPYNLNTSFISARHWVQAPLVSCIDQRLATSILYHDIFQSPLPALHYSILSSFRSSYCCFLPLYHLRFS